MRVKGRFLVTGERGDSAAELGPATLSHGPGGVGGDLDLESRDRRVGMVCAACVFEKDALIAGA